MKNTKQNDDGAGLIAVVCMIVFLVIGALFNMSTSSSSSESKEYVCRHTGCGRTPIYTDWERRFCSTHIQDDKYCRHPYCSERIPKTSSSKYCSKHR